MSPLSLRCTATCLLLLSFPSVAVAADALDAFHDELDAIQNELTESLHELNQEEEDALYEKSPTFFPADLILAEHAASGAGIPGDVQEEFVSLVEGGKSIVLKDVPSDQWFARYVKDMTERRIISGYADAAGVPLGRYGPADAVTVEQLAKISVLAAGIDQSKCPAVPKNKKAVDRWSAGFISCAEHFGWSVYQDGSVDPARPALRAEVVTTVLQTFQRDLEPATGAVFHDVSNTMSSRYAIETAARDGIVSGYADAQGNPTGFFGPFDEVNRAETTKIVSLAIQTYGL